MKRTAYSHKKLDALQRNTFRYFLKEANPANGLIPDNTREDAPCSIAAVGLALSCYTVAAERGWLTRRQAAERTLTTLRFFHDSEQSDDPKATGYKGFYYHFLDMKTGERKWKSELSTIDTTFLLAGALAAAQYFSGSDKIEKQIRELGDALYRRADWKWFLNDVTAVSHGWKPESGFLVYDWRGYNEALILYILGLGSPTHPLPEESFSEWTATYRWKKIYGIEFLYAGPLFVHQLPHVWIDLRGIQDEYMRSKRIDYFENSRRATFVQQKYAIKNPRGFRGYHENCWGISASDGPGPATYRINGKELHFYAYEARSVPFGPDDGTLSPWATTASIVFAPDIVLSALHYIDENYPDITDKYGFKCSFNPTFPAHKRIYNGWVSEGYFGLDQGPIVLMIENYRTGFFWRLMRECPYLVRGLKRAGFTGGWL